MCVCKLSLVHEEIRSLGQNVNQPCYVQFVFVILSWESLGRTRTEQSCSVHSCAGLFILQTHQPCPCLCTVYLAQNTFLPDLQGLFPHHLQVFTQISLLQWILPWWPWQSLHPNFLLYFSLSSYHLSKCLYNLLIHLKIIILATLECRLREMRDFLIHFVFCFTLGIQKKAV